MSADNPTEPRAGGVSLAALVAAGGAALLASTCCIVPLLLVLAGVSGAWLGSLAALEPYQPLFMAVSAVALLVAWRKIWAAPRCEDQRVCAAPGVRRGQKAGFIAVASLLGMVLAFPVFAPFFY